MAWASSLQVSWKGTKPNVESFMPIQKPKQTKEQMLANFGAMFGVAKQLAEQRKNGR